MNGSATYGCDTTVAELASVGSYWHMPNVKYAAVDMAHFDFEWSSRILGPSSSIKITSWRVQREFPHEKFGHTMFEMTKSSHMPL